jgi:secreted PhoX family phosphatase
MKHSRRQFFGRSGMVALAFAGLQRFVTASAATKDLPEFKEALQDDFYGTLDLMPGFSYTVISETGDKMDDGLLVPGKHDGMGAFAGPNGRTILVRNHELETTWTDMSPFGLKRALLRKVPRKKLYDAGKGKKPSLGGTTTLVFDTKEQRLEKHFLSLAGTNRNCAGGVTPWGSWVTCEEDTSRPNEDGQRPDDDMEREHGYNFEVPASDKIGLADPVPLKAMGRFRHEAVAVDPRTGVVYQTEDKGDGLFYRFLPNRPGELGAGGRLQALKLRDLSRADTRNWHDRKFDTGQMFAVEWVDIENVEAPDDDDLRYQGFFERGAARFARAEGCWFGRDAVFFVCTNGGSQKKGQIWRYVPSVDEGKPAEKSSPGKLELFIEPNDGKLVENADNLTIAPWGDLILCEDGVSPQFIVGVTPEGKLYKLARTTLGELAGACFSPDGTTLFVNIQTPGLTVAIVGPWKALRKSAV